MCHPGGLARSPLCVNHSSSLMILRCGLGPESQLLCAWWVCVPAFCCCTRSLPLVTPPGVFGFHENANLSKEMGETYRMMSELLLTMGQA